MDHNQFLQSFGFGGVEVISDTAAHTGRFVGLQVLAEASIAAIDDTKLSGNALTGVTLPAGTKIDLAFQSITLTSGTVLANKSALPSNRYDQLMGS